MKTDNTIKRERASIKLIKQFKMTNTEVAQLFDITKQRINEGINKTNKENFDASSLYHATDKEIELIKNMVEKSKYNYEDNEYKIRIINNNKEVTIILENKENIEKLKYFSVKM